MLEENDLDRRRASKPKTQAGTEAGAPGGLSGQRRSREPQGLSDATAMLREEYLGPCGAPPTVDGSERTQRGPTKRPVLLLRDAAQTGSRLDERPGRSQAAVEPGEVGGSRRFPVGEGGGVTRATSASPPCSGARNQMAGVGRGKNNHRSSATALRAENPDTRLNSRALSCGPHTPT